MAPPYTLDHAGLRCTLRAPGAAALMFVLLTAPAGSSGLVAAQLGAPFLASVLLTIASLIVALLLALWLRPRVELRCDGRTLEWQRFWGPIRGAKRRISLLDLHAIGAANGKLLIEPRPGPLQPVAIEARSLDPEVLTQLAGHLHEAIAQAERFRGDAPDQQTRTVLALTQREPS